MSVQGKVWGWTRHIISIPGLFELHLIGIKKGGVCSEHRHKYKWNGFLCLEGRLMIRTWQDNDQNGLVDETILYGDASDFTTVKPGLFHQFEALTEVIAIEIYWAELFHGDIERRTIGKMKE